MRKFLLYIFLFGVCPNLFLFADEGSGKTLVFKKTILKIALEQISVSENINLVYSDEVIEKKIISGSYTFTDIDITLEEILITVGLKIGIKKENVYVLVKDPIFDKKFSIKGIVLDNETGESLPYAQIVLLENGDNTIADKNGRFEFSNIPSGLFTLKTKYIGYSEFVYFFNSDSLTEDLYLPLSASNFKLKDVIIIDSTQSNLDIGNNSSEIIIASKSLSNLPFNGQADIFKCLKYLPGFGVNASGGSKLKIRGGLESQNQIILDGINLYHSDYLSGLFSTIPMEIVKDVRVYKSGYDASFGGKIAGIIDITTKNGNSRKANFSTEFNNLGINVSIDTPIGKRFSVLASWRKMLWPQNVQDVFKSTSLSKDDKYINFESVSKPEISFNDLYFKLTYYPKSTSLITFSFLSTYDKSDISFENGSYLEITDSSLYVDYKNQSDIKRKNFGASLNWYYTLSNIFKFKTTISFSNYFATERYVEQDLDIDYIYEYDYLNENSIKNLFFKFDSEYKFSQHLNIKSGLEYQNTNLDFMTTIGEEEIGFVQSDKSNLSSAYIQFNLKPVKDLFISPGIRVNHFSNSKKFYYEPRIRFSYQLGKSFNINGAYGKYHQYIQKESEYFRFRGWVASDEINYKPSSSDHIIAGLSYKNSGYIIDVEYFYINKKNIFAPFYQVKNNFGYEDYEITNGETGFSSGVEIQVIKNVGALTGWINYTYNNSAVNTKIANYQKEFRLKDVSPHLVNVVLNYKIGYWNFSSTFIYGTGNKYYYYGELVNNADGLVKFDDNIYFYEDHLPDFSRVDLSINREINLGWGIIKAGISFHNLFDRKNVWEKDTYMFEDGKFSNDYSGYGRTISFFAKIKF